MIKYWIELPYKLNGKPQEGKLNYSGIKFPFMPYIGMRFNLTGENLFVEEIYVYFYDDGSLTVIVCKVIDIDDKKLMSLCKQGWS